MIVDSAFFIVISGVALESLGRAMSRLAKRSGARPTTTRWMKYFTRLSWLFLSAMAVLYYTGLTSVFTTLTVSGIAGVAASLALQSTLSNMISGILLLQDKAIRLDDDIIFGGVRGRVVRIALRNTWIRTQEGILVLVSNSNLASGPLTNFTAIERLRDLAS
jgi:small-conductance mechanosensitive channel